MKSYEKTLKKLYTLSHYGRFPVENASALFPESDLLILAEKRLVALAPGGNNELVVSVKRLSYFYDKSDNRRRFVFEHVFNFFVGFLSGMALVIGTSLLTKLLPQLFQ